MDFQLTRHAEQRIRQRGRKENDVDFVFSHGTQCRDGILLTRKDRDRLIENAKRKIELASRLAGTFIACEGDVVKTVFQAGKRQQRRMLSKK